MKSTATDRFPGRVTVATFSDGSRHVVDPNRADDEVEVGHPNAWAGNMRHALVDADGADIHRGPQWRVEQVVLIRGRATSSTSTSTSTSTSAAQESARVIATVPAYADGMLHGLRLDPLLAVVATFIHPDGRVFHAVYRTEPLHRGQPRAEVHGVLLPAVEAADPHETWFPVHSLAESWRLEAPRVRDVAGAWLERAPEAVRVSS